jgi:RNA-directed DNA polymerase
VRAVLNRVATMPARDLYETANSYFGLFRQAPDSHADRATLAKLALRRGHTVDSAFTKTFRHPHQGAP